MRWLVTLSMLMSGAASAQPDVTSTYTSLDLDRCQHIERGEEPQSASWRCKGYGGIALFVQNGDDRYDVDAGVEDRDELWGDAFDYPGKTVEWRLSGGKPFAIIYRLVDAGSRPPRTSMLVVETIGRTGRPGCRIATVTGSKPNANPRARSAADRVLRSPATCIQPR
jgi:hypothetical protein